jgi:hypothetical protein
MINQGVDVPDKTIVIFPDIDDSKEKKLNTQISNILTKSPKKRDWFTPHFYRCLPLSIGNQYGFVITSEYDIEFVWDGGGDPDSLKFFFNEDTDNLTPRIESHFGSGIITVNPPFTLRTPPGVNLITMNPPNFIIPNVTVMTGVIETDNLRRNFTFNLKVQIPNIKVKIPKGMPIAAFMPIPRYFADKFNLEFAKDVFSKEIITEEEKAVHDANIHREKVEYLSKNLVGKHYMHGIDIYNNKFKDHQTP